MILLASEIEAQIKSGNIVIEPFKEKNMNPNSYDLTLGDDLLIYESRTLDPRKENKTNEIEIQGSIALLPDKIYLAKTAEYTETHKHVPILEGKSSLARLGLCIHSTAGFGDIGFCGNWTLELSVVQPVLIYPGMKICQIRYLEPLGDIQQTYAGKYQGSRNTVASRSYQDYE